MNDHGRIAEGPPQKQASKRQQQQSAAKLQEAPNRVNFSRITIFLSFIFLNTNIT